MAISELEKNTRILKEQAAEWVQIEKTDSNRFAHMQHRFYSEIKEPGLGAFHEKYIAEARTASEITEVNMIIKGAL